MARIFGLLLLLGSILIVNSQAIRGEWKTSMIANVITSGIYLRISDRLIRVNYNTSLTYNYTLDGNYIRTQFFESTGNYRVNSRPSENDLKNAIASFNKIQLNGDTLKIKSSNGNYVAVLKRVGNVDPEPIVTATIYVPHVPTTPVYVPTPTVVVVNQDVGVLKNVWSVRTVKGFPVIFDVSISNDRISFYFCNHESLPFSIQNNQIRILPQYSMTYTCPNLYPLEPQVLSAFTECDNYEVNDYFLYLKRGNEVIVFLQKV